MSTGPVNEAKDGRPPDPPCCPKCERPNGMSYGQPGGCRCPKPTTRPEGWLAARAVADHPEGPRVAVAARGTGEHILTLNDAVALRDSLDAAIAVLR